MKQLPFLIAILGIGYLLYQRLSPKNLLKKQEKIFGFIALFVGLVTGVVSIMNRDADFIIVVVVLFGIGILLSGRKSKGK